MASNWPDYLNWTLEISKELLHYLNHFFPGRFKLGTNKLKTDTVRLLFPIAVRTDLKWKRKSWLSFSDNLDDLLYFCPNCIDDYDFNISFKEEIIKKRI